MLPLRSNRIARALDVPSSSAMTYDFDISSSPGASSQPFGLNRILWYAPKLRDLSEGGPVVMS